MVRRLRLEIEGAVQGVGFRPFVFRLAEELGLAGEVANDPRGVVVEIEGPADRVETFVRRLESERPTPSRIREITTSRLEPRADRGFRIVSSHRGGRKTAQMLPDLATCGACCRDIRDATNRRHAYPFTNCTHCGPRLSIIEALPYDRGSTTMRTFEMCAACSREYDDPLDRRFHAQPNACPECGPQLVAWDAEGVARARGAEALASATAALQRGAVVALKGLGGFHLVVDAANGGAVRRLREGKPRRDKPFAVMARDLDQVRRFCRVPAIAEAALSGAEAPIVLLERRDPAPIDPAVAPRNPRLGVMLAYTPLHHLLLDVFGGPVVATSGNLSDEPICIDEREALERLASVVDLYLVHDRPIARQVDDSVAWVVEGEVRLLRRARGYAPRPVRLDREAPAILAVGGHLKNAVALSVAREALVSQHIGDMETPLAREAFRRVVADLLQVYGARPAAIAHDLHPDYVTTRWAREVSADGESALAGVPLIAVQHHHAHLASCLLENGHEGPALGVIWDGTGFGTDGTVWGGEFLVGDASGFRRVAHLRPFRLPGGDVAVREPRRSAIALLLDVLGEMAVSRIDLAPVRAFEPGQLAVLERMIAQRINAPTTSSVGRLFDGVAALVGIRQQCTFEGQAAMELEFAAAGATTEDPYPIDLVTDASSGVWILDWRPLIRAVLEDLGRGGEVSRISRRFHGALASATVAVCERVGQESIALSGGCFQNRVLLELTVGSLRRAGFRVLLHREVPPNDGGICLGQIAVAREMLPMPV